MLVRQVRFAGRWVVGRAVRVEFEGTEGKRERVLRRGIMSPSWTLKHIWG